MLDVTQLPTALASHALAAWNRWCDFAEPGLRDRAIAWAAAQPADARELAKVLALSDYAERVATLYPAAFVEFLETGAHRSAPPADFVGHALDGSADLDDLKHALRRLRNLAMLRVIWRDLNGHAALAETTGVLSRLADQLIDGALTRLHAWAVASDGEPVAADGAPQRLVVIAL